MFQGRTGKISILLDVLTGELIEKDTYEITALIRKVNESGETHRLIKHERGMVIIFANKTIDLNYDIKVGEGSPDQIWANPLCAENWLAPGTTTMVRGIVFALKICN